MPRGKQRNYTSTKGLSAREKESALSDPDSPIAKSQVMRSPSQKLSTTPKCGARLSTRGVDQVPDADQDRTCKQPAGHGTSHPGFGYCKFHGGNTAAGRKAGAKAMGRAIIQQRRTESAAFGDRNDPINDITPEQALLEEVRRSVALVRWLEEKISSWQIDTTPLTDPPTQARAQEIKMARGLGLPALTEETFKGTPYATDAHSWLILYREERDHMVRVSKLTIDAGIAERQVRLAENQGLLLATAINAILRALGLSPEQAAMVPSIVPQVLRQIASGDTIPGEVAPE